MNSISEAAEGPLDGAEAVDFLARLTARGEQLEHQPDWPADQLRLLSEQGVLRWGIPEEFGGVSLPHDQFVSGYIRLSEACLTTAFILTQRNAACARIANSDNLELKADLLPRLANGEIFATVGISHLTTSRQHLNAPAVQAEPTRVGWGLQGDVPWVTGAAHADYIVTGGTLADGRQILGLVPTQTPGVKIRPADRLLALNASHTSAVVLDEVEIESSCLLAGPVERVMTSGGQTSTGSLTTSALALGLAKAAVGRLAPDVGDRHDVASLVKALTRECTHLEHDLLRSARGESGTDDKSLTADALRTRANSLVLRATQAYLAASKGAGFVAGHPAERFVREALFFLVWSCPQPVLAAALRELASSPATS